MLSFTCDYLMILFGFLLNRVRNKDNFNYYSHFYPLMLQLYNVGNIQNLTLFLFVHIPSWFTKADSILFVRLPLHSPWLCSHPITITWEYLFPSYAIKSVILFMFLLHNLRIIVTFIPLPLLILPIFLHQPWYIDVFSSLILAPFSWFHSNSHLIFSLVSSEWVSLSAFSVICLLLHKQ